MEERLAVLSFGTLKDAGPEAILITLKLWAEEYWSMPEELQRKLYLDTATKALKGVISSPKATLESAIKDALPPDTEASGDGSSGDTFFEDVVPWDEAVDGAELLDQVAAVIRKYLYLPKGGPDIIALWAMFTYCWDAFDVWPILNVSSVVPGCGKSTLADVLNALVSRPMKCEHASGAVLFRMMELHRPTLIIDEADSFLDGNEELRGICNSGNRRGGCVFRCVGDDHMPQKFSTEGPKVIFGIGKRDATIYDRSISLDLQRKTDADKVERITSVVRMEKGLLPHRRKMKRWAEDHLSELEGSDPEMPDLRTDRAHDNWRPLFTIGELVEGGWLKRVQEASLAFDGQDAADGDTNVKIALLHDVDGIFEEQKASTLPSQAICNALGDMEHRPWPEWSKGKQISPMALAKQLAGFKDAKGKQIKSKTMRFPVGTKKGYERASLSDALARYPIPDKAEHPLQPSKDKDNQGNSTRNKTTDVTAHEPPETPHKTTSVTGVSDGNGARDKLPTHMSSLDVGAADEAAPEAGFFDDYDELTEREAIQDEPL